MWDVYAVAGPTYLFWLLGDIREFQMSHAVQTAICSRVCGKCGNGLPHGWRAQWQFHSYLWGSGYALFICLWRYIENLALATWLRLCHDQVEFHCWKWTGLVKLNLKACLHGAHRWSIILILNISSRFIWTFTLLISDTPGPNNLVNPHIWCPSWRSSGEWNSMDVGDVKDHNDLIPVKHDISHIKWLWFNVCSARPWTCISHMVVSTVGLYPWVL